MTIVQVYLRLTRYCLSTTACPLLCRQLAIVSHQFLHHFVAMFMARLFPFGHAVLSMESLEWMDTAWIHTRSNPTPQNFHSLSLNVIIDTREINLDYNSDYYESFVFSDLLVCSMLVTAIN